MQSAQRNPPAASGSKRFTISARPTRPRTSYGVGRRVIRQTLPDGREFRFNYKLTGACITHTSSPGQICSGPHCPTEDTWDNHQAGWRIHGGRIVAATVIKPDGNRRTHNFSARGVSTSYVDEQGQASAYKFDSMNRTVESKDVLGRLQRYEYDAKGNRTTVFDLLQRVMRYTYDAKWNRPTSITRYNDSTPFGEANAQTQRMTYDPALGVVTSQTTALGRRTEVTYTARGEMASIISPLKLVTRTQYTADGDVAKIADPFANEVGLGYDAVGRATTSTDALGYSMRTDYNGIDQVTQVSDELNQLTRMSYDAAQRLQSVTNPLNNPIESYGYDDGDRLTRTTDALNRSATMEYDSAGRLARMTDRKGQLNTFNYDTLGRVISIIRPEGPQYFSYDAVGRLATISDPVSSVAHEYDAADRLTAEVHTAGARRTRTEYQYDPLDRRTRRTVTSTSPDGNFGPDITDYAYDLDDRLIEIRHRGTGSDNRLTTYAWDADSRMTKKVLPNGITVDYTYDAASRLTSIEYPRTDGSLIERIAYEVDAKGQRTGKTSLADLGNAETAFTADYDAANRMTSITLNPGQANQTSYALSYDHNGNLARKTNTGDATDATTYTWDSRNRLIQLTAAGLTASFSYDLLGRRTERRITRAGDPAHITQYVYDGQQAVGEIRLPQGPITPQTTSLITGLNLDEGIARVLSGPSLVTAQTRTLLTDALNSVIAQTREDQSIQSVYGYSPYGQTTVPADDEGNSLEYTGRENDGTGIYFYRARYYDPILKRFVAEDRIGMAGGVNLYAYVGGAPTVYHDALGLWSWGDPLPQEIVDFSAGFGDTLSLGLTDIIRDWMGTNGVVDKCSGAYDAGEWAGLGVSAATGLAGGVRAAGTRGAGREFSHWIPNRMVRRARSGTATT